MRHAPLNLMRPLPALQWTTATAVFLRPKVWTWMATGEGVVDVSRAVVRVEGGHRAVLGFFA